MVFLPISTRVQTLHTFFAKMQNKVEGQSFEGQEEI